jgi:hypothetical protein
MNPQQELWAEQMIASLQPPCSPRLIDQLVATINAEAARVGSNYRQQKKAELAAAQTDKTAWDTQVEEHRSWYKDVADEYQEKRKDRGSLFLVALLLPCLVACLVAEYSLTLNTLPYILDIRKDSFEAMMLSLITVAAVASLKIVLGLLIWDRWLTARSHTSLWVRIAGWVLLVAFLLPVGAMATYTVYVIAPAREEVVKARRNLELPPDVRPEPVDWEKINRAVLWVSVAAAVNGALFALVIFKELNTGYWRTLGLLGCLRWRRRKLTAGQTQAEKNCQALLDDWQQIDKHVAEISDAHRARLMLRLEQVLKRPPQIRAARERVDEILGVRFSH